KFRHFWSRPDDRHIAGQDIDELRQLVELAFPEEHPQLGDPGVGTYRKRRAGAIGAYDHGAELIDTESATVPSDPLLTEENRATTVQLDEDCHENKYWQQHEEPDGRSYDVHGAFRCHRPARWSGWHAEIVVASHGDSPQNFAHNGGNAIDLNVGHTGKQRQRDSTCKISAGDGELAFLAMITLLPVGHLVQWPIMDRCADAFRGKTCDHLVTVGARILVDSYRKHVPGMKAAARR